MAEVCIHHSCDGGRRPAIRPGVVAAAILVFAGLILPALGASGPTGRVVGRVRLVAAATSRRLATTYNFRTLTPQGDAPKELQNVVVFLQGMPSVQVTPHHYQLRQDGELFLPHVLPIPRGSSVDFTNGDPFYHNVFSLSRAGTFDLGRFPRGQSRSREFSKPGLVKVFCHLHSDMSAVIMVLDHPWFTTPEADGAFVITDVPPGRHTVAAWHERVGEARTTVVVPSGGDATVEFVLPVVEP